MLSTTVNVEVLPQFPVSNKMIVVSLSCLCPDNWTRDTMALAEVHALPIRHEQS